MAKIISHDFGKAVSGAERVPGIGVFTRSFGCFARQLEDKKRLLEEMAAEARIFIAHEKMDPEEFVLSASYVKDFLCTELNMDRPDESSYAELVYHRLTPDRITSVCEFAVPQRDGKLKVSFLIYALFGYSEGNRVWELYNFEDGCWEKQDEDCFDPDLVLSECRRRWDP